MSAGVSPHAIGAEVGHGAVTGFFVAVSMVSLICFGVMMRNDRIRDRHRAYADSSGSDTGVGVSSGSDGFNLLSWFGGSSSSASDDSCSSSSSSFFSSGDGSCSDGGGGGDGGD